MGHFGRSTAPVLFAAFLVVVAQNLGCGSAMGTSRVLNSISVAPATADAQNFPSGQVQFTATGVFSAPPTPVSPMTEGFWSSMDTTIATVDQNGLAQCVSGAMGTVQIRKGAAKGGTKPGATSTLVQGNAQLTCP
jgi:hypothetical protein